MKKIIFILMIFLPALIFAQQEKMEEIMDDEMETMESGKLVLRFVNAENGTPVEAAEVNIQDLGDFTSDMAGKVLIDPPPDKKYSFHFAKDGYISATYEFEVSAGTVFSNRFSVSPVIDFGSLRVVLDWGRKPKDLDLHLVKEGDYHISFQNMNISKDGEAKLDRDDREGFGPETITLKTVDNNASYTCYIKNFTDQKSPGSHALSKSGALVRVYGKNQLLYTFRITNEKKGTTWMVFNIHNGRIEVKDEIGNQY